MKQHRSVRILLDAILTFGLALSASAALFTVSSTETWDGVSNPHAADGVTITGSGTDADPYTYTIPNGMLITSTGKIVLHSGGDNNIKFVIQGGNLQMDAGAVLNTERLAIRSGKRFFTLDLSGTNSITGAGTIGQRNNNDSTFRDLTIANVKNISLADVFMQVVNANRGPADFAGISIVASGAVYVSGTVDNSDRDSGGDGCGDITIKANTIDVNNFDARGYRNDPGGRDPYSGNVTLQALSPVGNYDPNDSVNNASTNKLTVRGAIRTFAVDPETIGGNVTLQSVVLQLVFGVIEVPPLGTKTLQVGELQGGATANDLFVNVSGSAETAANVVKWAGPFTPPPGSGPSFNSDPVVLTDATVGVAYSQTLVGTATDPNGDPLTFTKLSGPAWLTIAGNGAVSGTPALADSCTNSFQISVTDGTRFDTATLRILVNAGPRWNDGNDDFFYPDAIQNTPYAATLATNVIYCGAQVLSYAKVSGPAWLNVAADGTLSGTPDRTNVLENVWTVTVADATSTNDAILRIWVNGSPKFVSSPVLAPNARVGVPYASATLAGTAIDPQGLTISFAKLASSGPGPDWLTIAADGTLSGTPAAANFGTNFWTITADNGTYPATTNTLKIVVLAGGLTGPVEVVSREYWDGVENPHAADGVTLTGSGSAADPATYSVPKGLSLSANGQIYTSKATGARSQDPGQPNFVGQGLDIRFNIEGNLSMAGSSNAFVTAIHARNQGPGNKQLILDLNGTNSIVGAGRIVGLGNRVDSTLFPDCFDNDTPRTLTITNVNNVSMYDINVQVRNVNNTGRPLLIMASGKVEVTSTIDNSDRDTGGEGSSDVSVFAKEIKVNDVTTRVYRTGAQGSRRTGNITLKSLAPPGYNPADGANNTFANWLTISGLCVATNVWYTNTAGFGAILTESVALKLEPNASVVTAVDRRTLNVGKIQNGTVAADLFRNQSAGTYTADHVVDWSGAFNPASPQILFGAAAPGQIVLYWTGSGFVLQQNGDLSNPGGWVNAPSGTANPATNAIGAGNLFYRLKWPQ